MNKNEIKEQNAKPTSGKYSYSKTDLKPCPFCGGDPYTTIQGRQWGGDGCSVSLSVICSQCKISKGKVVKIEGMNFFTLKKEFDELISKWNERV